MILDSLFSFIFWDFEDTLKSSETRANKHSFEIKSDSFAQRSANMGRQIDRQIQTKTKRETSAAKVFLAKVPQQKLVDKASDYPP